MPDWETPSSVERSCDSASQYFLQFGIDLRELLERRESGRGCSMSHSRDDCQSWLRGT